MYSLGVVVFLSQPKEPRPHTSFVFDVTNVSTHKCRFVVASTSSDTTTHGHSSQNETHVTFLKMGDT